MRMSFIRVVSLREYISMMFACAVTALRSVHKERSSAAAAGFAFCHAGAAQAARRRSTRSVAFECAAGSCSMPEPGCESFAVAASSSFFAGTTLSPAGQFAVAFCPFDAFSSFFVCLF